MKVEVPPWHRLVAARAREASESGEEEATVECDIGGKHQTFRGRLARKWKAHQHRSVISLISRTNDCHWCATSCPPHHHAWAGLVAGLQQADIGARNKERLSELSKLISEATAVQKDRCVRACKAKNVLRQGMDQDRGGPSRSSRALSRPHRAELGADRRPEKIGTSTAVEFGEEHPELDRQS